LKLTWLVKVVISSCKEVLDKEKSGGSSDPEFIDVCAYGKGPLVHFCDQLGKFPVIVDICEPIAKGDDT
jgi:hypothetical protein